MTAAPPEAPGADTIVRVYKYGILPQRASGGGWRDLPPALVAEIQRAHRLRNKLVEIELRYQEKVQQIWQSVPEIARLTAEVEGLAEAEAARRQEVARLEGRKAGRGQVSPEDLQLLGEARTAHKDARMVLKKTRAALKAAKGSRAYVLLKEQFEAAKQACYAQIKAEYRVAVDDGLYWATYNAVTEHHKTAVKLVTARRKEGAPAQLRFKRFDGTGTVAVQLQAAGPARTPEEIAAGSRSTVFQLHPWVEPARFDELRKGDDFARARAKELSRGVARFRFGSDAFAPGRSADRVAAWIEAHEQTRPMSAHWRLVLSWLALDADVQASAARDAGYRGTSRNELRSLVSGGRDPLGDAAFGRLLHALERAGYVRLTRSAVFLTGTSYSAVAVLPVRLHRMMPAGAEIVSAQVTRKRIGRDYRAHLEVTARIPRPPMKTSGPLAAVHLGWRVLEDGAIRAAVVSGIGPPDHRWIKELGIVRSHDGWHEVIIPASWREVYGNPARVRSQCDRNRDDLRRWLLAWLKNSPRDAEFLCAPDELRERTSSRFYRSLVAGLEAEEDLGTLPKRLREVLGYLRAWAKQDDHLTAWQAHERDQITGRRNYAWQLIAKWVCQAAAVVVVDGWDLAAMSRVRGDGQDLPAAARANRVLASPGKLRSCLVQAGVSEGAHVRLAEKVSKVHGPCGTPLSGRELMLHCDGCREMVDQDVAALEQLAAWAMAA